MGELFTAIKVFIFSFVILMALQMKWQGMTLERQALIALHQSKVGETIEQVSMGATKAIHNGTAWTKANFDQLWSKVSSLHSSTTPAEQRASR